MKMSKILVLLSFYWRFSQETHEVRRTRKVIRFAENSKVNTLSAFQTININFWMENILVQARRMYSPIQIRVKR